jgi:hypothetical protein
MWTEHDRSTEESIAWFANRHRRQVDPAALAAQNQALAAENARLQQELEIYKRNYRELDVWARDAEKQIARLLKERNE